MQIGLFGLGRMGMQIAKRLQKNGFDVLAWNRSIEPRQEFQKAGGKVFATESELLNSLTGQPRVIWIMLPHAIMDAIAEGFGIMEASKFKLDLGQVSKIYQTGSVVSSWLIDLTRNIFEKENVAATSGFIDSTGEGEWTIKTAMELGVDARVIKD